MRGDTASQRHGSSMASDINPRTSRTRDALVGPEGTRLEACEPLCRLHFPSLQHTALDTYLARNADLLVDKELVDVRPLVSGHLHDVPALGIAHDRTVTAGNERQKAEEENTETRVGRHTYITAKRASERAGKTQKRQQRGKRCSVSGLGKSTAVRYEYNTSSTRHSSRWWRSSWHG